MKRKMVNEEGFFKDQQDKQLVQPSINHYKWKVFTTHPTQPWGTTLACEFLANTLEKLVDLKVYAKRVWIEVGLVRMIEILGLEMPNLEDNEEVDIWGWEYKTKEKIIA